jgi:hypothetical protein
MADIKTTWNHPWIRVPPELLADDVEVAQLDQEFSRAMTEACIRNTDRMVMEILHKHSGIAATSQ